VRRPADDGTLPLWADGAAARDEGIACAESAQGAEWDRHVIDQAIMHYARTGLEFSANDLRGLLPAVAGSMIGARFLAAARAGTIVRAGATHASHRAGHARLLSTWRGQPGTAA